MVIFVLCIITFILTVILDIIIENAEKDKLFIPKFKIKFKPILLFYFFYILLVLLFCFFKHGFSAASYFQIIILLTFFAAAIIDIKYRIVPDLLNLFLIIIALTFWEFHIISGIIIFGFMFMVYKIGKWIFKQEALGFGDVKLFTIVGILFGISNFFNIFFYSFLISAILGLFLIIFRKNKDHTMPFVPFISITVTYFMLFGGL